VQTTVLKLGGGALTEKDTNRRQAKLEVIRRLAREIRRARETRPSRLVLVHGAGPFGHGLVAEHGIAEGVRGAQAVEGFVRTHHSMRELGQLVLDRLREEGLLAVAIPPCTCLVQDRHAVADFFLEPIERLLALDDRIIPVLHGDMVADRSLGASVVSGDVLVAELGRRLGAHRVLLGTDVAGIFSADPKRDPAARPVPRIDRENLAEVLEQVSPASTVDVTRGMRGKLEAIACSLAGLEVLIFDLTEEGSLERALTGEAVRGTEIRL
jgi:isopentenyl phosphate kinase